MQYKVITKYLLTGGLAFAVDFALLLACYHLLMLPLWVATTIGYAGGLCISFFINRTWVYGGPNKQHNMVKQLVEYIALLLFNYAFTVVTISILSTRGVTPGISKIFVTGIIVCWNYVIFSKVIFAHKKAAERE